MGPLCPQVTVGDDAIVTGLSHRNHYNGLLALVLSDSDHHGMIEVNLFPTSSLNAEGAFDIAPMLLVGCAVLTSKDNSR